MKRLLILILLIFSFANLATAENSFSESPQNTNVRYRLFPTQNMWTFLKLDTMTGKIWQVQFSVQGADYRFETILNSKDITRKLNQERKIGRFTLYPTENTYNFILLDQIDGHTYQVQWSTDKQNRVVLPISD